MLNQLNFLNFNKHGDDRGSLVSLEIGPDKLIPFEIKRVYYIYRTQQDVVRGKHAHKNLKQVVFAINGSCSMLLDDGVCNQVVDLNDPTKGLLIENNIWREIFNFSDDCILLVLASNHYDEDDYIRSYDKFLEYKFDDIYS